MINIVLLEPEIPANTGNIGRTCVATGSRLHLIEPLGFHLSERNLKRAGMDYWNSLDVRRYSSYADFLDRNPGVLPVFATTKAKKLYTQMEYPQNCYILFGKESAGIPEEILMEHPERCVRIPMVGDTRSLNLSNSVCRCEGGHSVCSFGIAKEFFNNTSSQIRQFLYARVFLLEEFT